MENDLRTAALSDSTLLCRVVFRRFLDLGREEHGAALVVTLAMFFLMYLAIMGVFAVSTAVKERIHLQNACDAAAYSAAVVQADTLSRIATINRAMSWTYVDMTRLQMDYIVRHWLEHTCSHYEEDLNGGTDEKGKDHDSLSDYNINSIPHVLGLDRVSIGLINFHNGPCGMHRGFFMGYYIGSDGTLPYTVHLNGRSSFKYRLPKGAGKTRFPKVSTGHDEVEALVRLRLAEADFEYLSRHSVLDLGNLLRQLPSDVLDICSETVSVLSSYETSEQTKMVLADNMNQVRKIFSNWSPSGSKPESDLGVPTLMKIQIALDKIAIGRMNVCERALALALPGRIDRTVQNIVNANLGGVLYDMDRDQLRYLVVQSKALSSELAGRLPSYLMSFSDDDLGYLRDMFNTKSDETEFLAFSGHELGIEKTFETGIDQWFVRGNGSKRTDGAYGIQRSYKHWADSSQPLAEFHATHSPLMPTAWNTEKLDQMDPSVALFSEWQWWSDTWFCFDVWTPAGYITVHLNVPHAWELWPSKATCSHKSKPGLLGLGSGKMTTVDWKSLFTKGLISGIASKAKSRLLKKPTWRHPYWRLRSKNYYDSITGGLKFVKSLDDLLGNYEPIAKYHDGCVIYPEIVGSTPPRQSVFKFTGYSRLYADDPDLYNGSYIGFKALPLVLDSSYFGTSGTISVGIRRENENVFLRILGKIEGIFKAFDPDWNEEVENTYSYVFASAKAGYKDKGEAATSRAYKVHWDERVQGQRWNLCQSDWDAVFVPVRKAHAYALGAGADSGLAVSAWRDEGDALLVDWVSSGNWRTLNGNGADGNLDWRRITAPHGVLRGNGHDGTLNWESLSHVMYH